MNNKQVKKLRKLTKGLKPLEYDGEERRVYYTKTADGKVLRHKGVPRVISVSCGRAVLKIMKKNYNAR